MPARRLQLSELSLSLSLRSPAAIANAPPTHPPLPPALWCEQMWSMMWWPVMLADPRGARVNNRFPLWCACAAAEGSCSVRLVLCSSFQTGMRAHAAL